MIMPGPWKNAKFASISRLVTSIRSKRGDSSPLVVQTGFPTSLADLVVKNRSRLKKPKGSRSSSKRQQCCPDSFGCRVSEIVAAVQSPSSPDACGAVVVDEVEISEECAVVAGSVGFRGGGEGKEISKLSPVSQLELNKEVVEEVLAGGRWKIGLVGKVLLVMILAVCSKGLVLGVMSSAFALLLFEFVGNRSIASLNSSLNAKKKSISLREDVLHECCSDKVSTSLVEDVFHEHRSDKVSNSPREDAYHRRRSDKVAIKPLSDGVGERRMDFVPESEGKRSFFTEREDLSKRSPANLNDGVAASKVKKKKHWSKHVAERFRSQKRGKETNDPCSDSSNRGGASEARQSDETMEESGETEDCGKDDNDDDAEISQNLCDTDGQIAGWVGGDMVGINSNAKSTCTKHMIPFVVVLAGLVGGRFVALCLTVAWWYLVKLTGILRKKLKVHSLLPWFSERRVASIGR